MFGLTVVTPPADGPVTAAQLRARLRLNDDSEDDELSEMLGAAVELFEHDTGRPVLATGYRQDLGAWPAGPVVLGRGGVTAVTAVGRYLADGSAEDLAAGEWVADLTTAPPRVYLAATPAAVTTAAGIAVSPVGYVRFTAGWANAAAVPKAVLTALKLMGGHWYENREAHREGALAELPDGWRRVVAKYKTGVSGAWGQ